MIVRGKCIGGGSPTVGINSKVFTELLNDIENSDLMVMDSVDLLTIINQGILPNNKAIRSILTTDPFSDERKANLEKIKFDVERGLDVTTPTQDEDEIPEDDEETDGIECGNSNITSFSDTENKKDKEEDKKLAKIRIVRGLKTIDNSLINAIADEEAIKVLMTNKLRKMWESVINNDITIEEIMAECPNSGKYYNKIATHFKKEYDMVCSYKVPKGFNAHNEHKDGTIEYFNPNMMQKLCVKKLLENHYYGNWSGMGSGKTLSAIIASREINSHLTVVVALNSNTTQWGDSILNAYPESTGTRVYYANDKNYDTIDFDMTKYNYLILPYSRFSLQNEEQKIKAIADKKVDFIVIDEVHKAKRRGEDSEESKRRERLMKLIGWCQEVNANLYKMVMSGTPIINDLSEAKSLLTLLTGNEFEDIKTTRTLSNALKLHQMLLIYGFRFVPKYDQELNILTGDNTECLRINGDKYLYDLQNCKSIDMEKKFVEDKLCAIKPYIKKGALIYTHYTTGIIPKICDFVENCGYTTASYTGDNISGRDDELKRFKKGLADIMIASDPINTGVDGLQDICNTMIVITLPWTNAEFEQLKGRIYRQGMGKDSDVTIIIPQVFVTDDDGNEWSWDKQRYNLIKAKKTLADCVIDGVIPSTTFPKRETLYKKSIESLKIWKDRINSNDYFVREDSGVTINLDVEIEEEQKRRNISLINDVHRKAYSSHSDTMFKTFTREEEVEYHKARRESMKNWEEDPVDRVAAIINTYPSRYNRIIDMGCGENKLKTLTTRFVQGVNLNKMGDDTVIEANMAHLEGIVNDGEYNVVVFCLSLWGLNYDDYNEYFKEAKRILDEEGRMIIVEPFEKFGEDKSYGSIQNFIHNIEGFGFKQVGKETNRYNKIFFEFSKF